MDRLATALPAERTVMLTGFTRARTVMDLSAETSGKVEKVFADVGDKIPDEGKFACLDSTFVDLDIAINRYEMARIGVEMRFFEKQVGRYRQLVDKRSSAQLQLDEVERSLAASGHQLEKLNLQDRVLKERKRLYCITAPPGWLVIERFVEPGEWLSTGNPVAKIGDFSRLVVPFALAMAEYRALLDASKDLHLHLPDIGVTVPAQVGRISPGFDAESRKIKVEIQIDGGMERLRGGVRAELSLIVPSRSDVVLVPENAVQERYEEFWLQRADGEEVRVVYLGRAGAETEDGMPLVRVRSPEVAPGDRFRLHGN